MKKALVLLLALCMLLTLCACADASEKEFEAAKALYDAGDYENAIEALQNVGHYAEIAGMIADAQKQLAAESYGFLLTTWKDVRADGTNTVIFHEDGTCDLDGSPMQYSMGNDKVTVAGILTLDITQEDGIYHLAGEDVDYVREEDYDTFIAEHTVELTLDNYLDYFEWVEERIDNKDAYGNFTSVFIRHILTPKDEKHVNRDLSCVEIGYSYETTIYAGNSVHVNVETFEYSGGERYTNTVSCTAEYYTKSYGGGYLWDPVSYSVSYAEDGVSFDSAPEVVRVEGQLVIW